MHIPVLPNEIIAHLRPAPGRRYIDGTLGAGGHSQRLLDAGASVLAFDRDPLALQIARERLPDDRFTAVHASFTQMGRLAPAHGFDQVDGILLDLGFSSMQVDTAERGFSFQAEGPLDMRFDTTIGRTAADLVNTLPEAEIADLIYEYGEERHSRRIARAIVGARPIETTTQLANIVRGAVPTRGYHRIDPATRTFQALRIAVNDELGALEAVLPQAVELLAPGGRLAVISFHSLEDRIVKHFIREEESDCICPPELPMCACDKVPRLQALTRKPIEATEAEVEHNPRARSAKLRVAERIDDT